MDLAMGGGISAHSAEGGYRGGFGGSAPLFGVGGLGGGAPFLVTDCADCLMSIPV